MNHLAKLLTKLRKTKRNHSLKDSARKRFGNRLGLEKLEERSLMAGLVSSWTADNIATDAVGGNHGTLLGGATYASGQIAQAFQFDGLNDSVAIGDPESLKLTNSLTIEGWVRVDSYPSTAAHGHILFRGDDRNGLDPYFLAVSQQGQLKFNIGSLTGNSLMLGGNLPLGQFVHVAATLNDATGAQRLYVNGILAAETVTSVRPFGDLDTAFNPGVAIGHHAGYPNSPHTYAFNGRIDELSIYDQALTTEEVLGRFNAGKGDTPPTKFYVVDDATANKTFEYDGTGVSIENYSLGSGSTAPRGAASTAAGDMVWVVDANKKVYVYDTSGGLFGEWSLGSLASNATVEGITTNGTDIWIVDSRSDKVFKYAGAATRTTLSQNAFSSFPLHRSNTSPTDLVTDGTSIWVLNNTSSTDKVFKYSVDGSLLGSWTITSGGGSPTGLTIDPTTSNGNIWIVDNNTDRVYQFDSATTRTRDSASPSSSFALATGNSNPQGIADPPPPASKLTSQGVRVAIDRSMPEIEKPNRKSVTSSNLFIAQVDSIFENWNEDSVSSQTKKRLAGRR